MYKHRNNIASQLEIQLRNNSAPMTKEHKPNISLHFPYTNGTANYIDDVTGSLLTVAISKSIFYFIRIRKKGSHTALAKFETKDATWAPETSLILCASVERHTSTSDLRRIKFIYIR